MGNRGPKEEGIGKGGSMWDYIFLEKNAKGDGYSDVRDVFRPYLTPLNVGLGGKPLGEGEGGNTIIINSWATKVSSGMERPEGTLKFIRSIDAYTHETIKNAPDHTQAQYWAYHRGKDEWEEFYSGFSGTVPATPAPPVVNVGQPQMGAAGNPPLTQEPAAVTPPAQTAESKTFQNWREVIDRVAARAQAEGRSPNAAEIAAIEEATAAKDVEVMRTMILEHPINPKTNNPWMVGDRMKYLGRDYLFYGGEWHLE
jgi:hypothetical protein